MIVSISSVLAYDPHSGHTPGGTAVLPQGVVAFARSMVLITTAATVGTALSRPVAGPPSRGGRLTIYAVAFAAAAAQMAVILAGELWLAAIPAAMATMALPGLLHRPRVSAAAGGVLTVALSAYAATTVPRARPAALPAAGASDTGHAHITTPVPAAAAGGHQVAHLVLALAHGLAATVLIGAALAVATAADRRAAASRLTAPMLAAVVVLVVGGLIQALLEDVRPDRRLESVFGVLLLVKATVAAGCAMLVIVARRHGKWHGRAARAQAAGAAVAVACGAVLTVLPFPATPPKPGVPLLRDVTVAGRRVPVFVAPGRPGWNLVHVGADRASVGMDRQRLAPASARPGTTQLWATVWMPAGRGRLWIGYRGATAALPFDTGRRGPAGVDLRGPDGPECASVALGRVIAGVDTPLRSCPSGALSDSDADALTAMVRFIAGRGVHALALVGDVSARGVRATAYVRAAAGRFGLSVLDLGTASPRRSGDEGRVPVAVVSGWAGADGVVQAVSRGRLVAEGVYLAPWLLNAPLLAPAAGQLIPLRFHPGDPPALRYIAALNRRFPGDEATQAGFLGWSSRVAGVTAPLRLYAASRIFVPGGIGPLSLDHGGHGAGHWLPDGAVVPITGPLNRI